jgi:hypothetical protein
LEDESEEHKAALYQEAEGLLNDISKSEEHFEPDSGEVGYYWRQRNYVQHTALLSLQHRAWT